jgi:tRNA-dihydrouridine synthase A
MNRKFAIAPMMDWTDRHCRFFHRLLTRRALLYTEMVTTGAVLHGDRARLIGFDPAEHPVALQLGGCEPKALAQCAAIGADFGYDEINLNVGCPSDRVQEGRFGACLMAEPALVADCVAAMKAAVAIPVTVKCRIGIDDQDSEADLERFVSTVAGAGCATFIVHARKAWLEGLSPKENREVPPLDYGRVYRLKAAHPELEIVLNGGIGSLEEAETHLAHVDGVALGRAAYLNPYLLAEVDGRLFGDDCPAPTRRETLEALLPYVERHLARGGRLNNVTRHLLGLYHGRPRARAFRRHLSERAPRDGADIEVLLQAIRIVEGEAMPALAAAE